jgi:hypothetical protein
VTALPNLFNELYSTEFFFVIFRGTMLFNSWIFLVGGLIMTFASSVYWLIPARLIIGFASGQSSVVVPVYLGAEIFKLYYCK